MKRRRGGAKSASRSPELSKQATSPETRLRRPSTRGASLTPSKPTRRQPTEALHMTTRAAGKAASTQGTDSTASSEASGSRRSSLNDHHDQPDDAEIDRRQHASSSSSQSDKSVEADEAHLQRRDADRDAMDVDVPGAPDSDTSSQDHDQESLDTSKNGNKRKRSSAADEISQHQPHAHANGVNGTSSPEEADQPVRTSNHPDPEPPRKRARGGWRGRGRGRGRGGRGGLTLSTHASFQTDATSTPPSAGLQDRDHLSDDQHGSERPTKQPKRLPGRRRAPNADPSVEADLRRQLQLKTAYRAVVKVLKPVLAELADRAINDVEDDPKAHEQSDQHDIVKAALDARLAERIAYLDRKLAISTEHVERRKTAEEQIARTAYENYFFNLQEDYVARCQHKLLTILREEDKQTQDGYATDDEDGLVPRRRGMQYKWRPTGFLDPRSDSRSRFYLETDKLWKDFELRDISKKETSKYLDKNTEEFDKNKVTSREDFAIYDADARDYALAIYNANALAHACQAIENGTAPPAIKPLPNEDATGLQLLVSAIENPPPPPPVPLPTRVEERKYEERITPRSTPAAEISTPRVGSVPSRVATSTPKSTRGRRGRGGHSARSTPVRAPARSRTSTPAPIGFDDSFEPTEPGSAMSASMSIGTETRDPSPRKTTTEPTPAARTPDEPAYTVPESPMMNGGGREIVAEPQPPRQPSVSSNRITDLLNKGDDPLPQIAPFVSSSPAALPPAILQPLPHPSSTPSAPLSETPRLPAQPGQLSDSNQYGLPAQLSQPVDRSERAQESYISTLSEPEKRVDLLGAAQQRPTTAPTEVTRQDAVPARKTFWDTITIGNKSRPSSPQNADKTPLARIRQILNPSNFPRRTDSPTGTTPPATATSSNDRLSERPEMAPPASRASVSNDATSSRRSSGAASVVSQSAVQPPARSPVEAPKRTNSRDKGLEQRQNRWRAAVPPQHGPTPPFRPDSNPPQNAFLKHQGWTAESQARLSQQSAASPPQTYPSYAPPYGPPIPPPPPPGPYNQSYPLPNPNLSAVPFVSPPFTCPPGPPPYQSIYAPPSQGYPPPPQGGYGPPPPPLHQQPGPPPPPGPPQQHYGTQYGGQPILPATIDRRGSGGTPGAQAGSPYSGSPPQQHPPAFSQQQNQYGGHGGVGHGERGGRGGHGGRRRWKNTAPGTEFRPYTGPKRH